METLIWLLERKDVEGKVRMNDERRTGGDI